MGCGILVLQPGIDPASPALAGEFLTTGPPRKFLLSTSNERLSTSLRSTYTLITHVCRKRRKGRRARGERVRRKWTIWVNTYFPSLRRDIFPLSEVGKRRQNINDLLIYQTSAIALLSEGALGKGRGPAIRGRGGWSALSYQSAPCFKFHLPLHEPVLESQDCTFPTSSHSPWPKAQCE